MRAVLPLCLAAMVALPAAGRAAAFEDEVLAEVNRVRADPQGLARDLARYARETGLERMTNRRVDDAYAVEEAIDFLRRQPALPPLEADARLAAAAEEHVEGQGPTGRLGHGPPDAFGRRIRAHGVFAGMAGETISYGQRTPRDVVWQLIIDYGVPDRGHRSLVFDRMLSNAGVACGPHADYGRMCVIDFAGGFPRGD